MIRSRAAGDHFAACLILILTGAALMRGLFPTADPPWNPSVGVVWHDEGAWVHNARNKVLFGDWRQDNWNPVYIAPVFTAAEYLSFSAFGVGVWQARLVSELAGFASVVLLALGVRRLGGNLAGLIAAGLLATNFVYVMYNRAAIMEALMASFIVASWYCSTRAERTPVWGAAAGLLAAVDRYRASRGLAALPAPTPQSHAVEAAPTSPSVEATSKPQPASPAKPAAKKKRPGITCVTCN